MPKNFVSDKDESVRMFDNNFLDFFSRVHFSMPLIIFIPVIAYLFYRSLVTMEHSVGSLILWLIAGLFVWTFIEYVMHRFIFHYPAKSKLGKRIHFISHGVHHDYPNDSKRLVLPPVLSIPLAGFFYILFYLILGVVNVAPFFIGILTGYLFYDMMHYAFHHAHIENSFFKALKKHHMKHHFQDPDNGFGVSSTIWDVIFRTTYKQ